MGDPQPFGCGIDAYHLRGHLCRYRIQTLRRLVFIGMLQDAGLTLDDINGILYAPIGEVQQARDVLAAALLCRYDHPATGCMIMGAEIDRRLDDPAK